MIGAYATTGALSITRYTSARWFWPQSHKHRRRSLLERRGHRPFMGRDLRYDLQYDGFFTTTLAVTLAVPNVRPHAAPPALVWAPPRTQPRGRCRLSAARRARLAR